MTDKRLIDADKLLKDIRETYEYEFPTASGAFDEFVTKILPNIICNEPTVDAVPVVRCKDCAKREICRTSTVWAVLPNDDWFCADGERRDGEQDDGR